MLDDVNQRITEMLLNEIINKKKKTCMSLRTTERKLNRSMFQNVVEGFEQRSDPGNRQVEI